MTKSYSDLDRYRELLRDADDEPKRLALIQLLIDEGAKNKLASLIGVGEPKSAQPLPAVAPLALLPGAPIDGPATQIVAEHHRDVSWESLPRSRYALRRRLRWSSHRPLPIPRLARISKVTLRSYLAGLSSPRMRRRSLKSRRSLPNPGTATISLGGSPCCSVIPRLPPKLRPLERPDSPQPLPCLTKSLNIPAPGKSGRRWENIGRFKLAESLTAGGFY